MPEENKEAESKDDENNLWYEFLANAGKSKGLKQTGHLIVLGNSSSGKTALVSQFKKLESKTGEMKKFLLMRYAFVELSKQDSDETQALLNIWQISEPEHAKVLDSVIKPEQMPYVAYIVCIDLSQPQTVQESYNKWMTVLQETQTRLLSKLDPQKQGELKDKLYSLVQFYVNPNDAAENQLTEEQKAEMDLQRENPEINLGCPIIFVGTKTDAFKKSFQSEAEANDRYDLLISYIRYWNLKYGAGAFTMAAGLKEQARRILQYIQDRLFDSTFNRAPNVVVSLANLQEEFLFVPTGFDSVDIIKHQAENTDLNTPFSDFFPPITQNEKKVRGAVKLRSTEDTIFLKTFEFDLKEAANKQGSGAHRSPAKPTRNINFGSTATNNTSASGNKPTSTKKAGNEAVQKFFQTLLTNPQTKEKSNATPTEALQQLKNDTPS